MLYIFEIVCLIFHTVLNVIYYILSIAYILFTYHLYRGKNKGTSGDDESDDDDEEDLDTNVWPYFNTSCYSGPDDSITGFYTVYNDVFSKLRDIELNYAEFNGDTEIMQNIPLFGNSTSSDDEVQQFYGFWSSFVSCLSFANSDKYDTNDESIPRYMRR